MRRYARVQDGIVAELFSTALDITTLFSPTLLWVEITEPTPVSEGWLFEQGRFQAPATAIAAPEVIPTFAELQLQIQRLSAQLDALGQHA